MSALKIKDDQGNWINLPGLKGDKGDKGDKGESGVYLGTTAPSDEDINVWINPNGEAHTEAVVIDTTLTQEGQAADSKVVGDKINDIKENLNSVLNTVTIKGKKSFYSYESYDIKKDSVYLFVNNGECVVDVITTTSADATGTRVERVGSIRNGASLVFTATLSANALRVEYTDTNGSLVVTEISDGFPKMQDDVNRLETGFEAVSSLADYNTLLTWEVGSIYASGAEYDTSTRAIRTPKANMIYIGSDSIFSIDNNNVAIIYAFKYNHENGTFIERLGEGNTNPIQLSKGYDYRFIAIAVTGTVITTETIPTYSSGVDVLGNNISLIYDSIMISKWNNYSVDSAFNKHLFKKLTLLGDISLHQSFCIYNNKIYSTNGSYIAVQNLATLAEENRISFQCGHGNSFQLGSSNLAYISGWDDQKIYVVDLDNLTLSTTITLPTTGYTTCAVDDVNKLAYIFQLDTTPSVGGFYNFIVYDYNNEQIISTKKITFKIKAMQGIDFYNGRIVVLSGLGTNTDGNKYSIFNTNGDLISELFVGDLESIEPEGVFVDRNTFNIYLSYLVENVGYKLYKLT